MLDKDKGLQLPEIAEHVLRIAKKVETARYSIEDVSDLKVLSKQLLFHAREIKECCF